MLLYRLGISLIVRLLPVAAMFNEKIRLALSGRKNLFEICGKHYATVASSRKRIVIHVSSFGELEQAKPVIKQLKSDHPDYHIHLTFFSPSGYENTVNRYTLPDLITYLPFDTKKDIRAFLDIIQPDLFIFVRYDVWHTLVDELSLRQIKTILICATFDQEKKKNPVVKDLYKSTYSKLNSILTIRESDREALLRLGIDPTKMEIAGDTRFDQVLARKKETEAKTESFLPSLAEKKVILVAGSTWEPDEKLLRELCNDAAINDKLLLILVPHEVDLPHIESLRSMFAEKAILLSAIAHYSNEPVIIVDSIGKLFSLYKYADIAYVGGGFGAGVHNTLEVAVWGVPVVCGPKIERSKEIGELVAIAGATIVADEIELKNTIKKFSMDSNYRVKSGMKAKEYIESNNGGVEKTTSAIEALV